MTGLRVLSAGLQTTVQDLGRTRWQRIGFPAAGAMDPLSAVLANRLVGNPAEAAVLEITVIGPVLELEREALVAVTGGDLGCEAEPPAGERRPVPLWTAVVLPAGSRIRFRGRRSGARAYLAVDGGIDVEPVGGSRSTGLAGGFSGLHGRPLAEGDVLPLAPSGGAPGDAPAWSLPVGQRPVFSGRETVRVVPGPDLEFFAPEAVRRFFAGEYRVGIESNRMGIRLEGPEIPPYRPATGLSEPQPLGTIQVPGGGRPIILMQDRQTVGGYPKLGVVCRPDLARLAQLLPGERVQFAPVSVEEAQRLLREWLAFLAEPPLVRQNSTVK